MFSSALIIQPLFSFLSTLPLWSRRKTFSAVFVPFFRGVKFWHSDWDLLMQNQKCAYKQVDETVPHAIFFSGSQVRLQLLAASLMWPHRVQCHA